ncbi:beta-galactosidase [Catenuloplanes indicus]|uniref:Beta-galactosidase n=1 Tax=Catenuloplanes indicus TaxID=137267 RepID=A0AAE4B245_9ACTN|nr:beta-galactosidase [Catenuloplanes indicus]MDQ0371299.1 beta-galactosidase [Catenuloplanes indicus]
MEHRWLRWPSPEAGPRMAFGADYNPDQWPREVWDEDVAAMREAGVNIVSIAIFSWARIQPNADTFDWAWLDDAMDLLHANGIAVDLATATASPPPWLTTSHPEILPVDHAGNTLWPGARQHWRPTSPIFREYALRLVRELATRYANHPALTAWHVSNELGCHNVYDFSDDAARAFRTWLKARYGTIEALNDAWATAFWSQRYSAWGQILPPRQAASYPNPTQQLDFKRFSSDALKEYLVAEREILRELTPDVPVTTNFMVMGETKGMNYADWASEVDFVSNDHYFWPGPQGLDELSFSANLTGHIASGRPWFLMEHSTSAVNWQPINLAKRPGDMSRDSLIHVAHGADAVCFFQWRQSKGGAEKYHSAMLPHAGTDSAVFRAVARLGQDLRTIQPVAGTAQAPSRAAILFDWDSWWASELDSHPTEKLRYRAEALDWYTAFLANGVPADVIPASSALENYDLVVAPILHVVPGELASRLESYVAGGGHLVTTYFSGIVDQNDHIWLGGYPGALRDLLGIRIEEFGPLYEGDSVTLDNGADGTLWTDRIDVTGSDVEVLAWYKTGEHAGRAAITRRTVPAGSSDGEPGGDGAPAGTATYVSTRLGPEGLTPLLADLLRAAGITSPLPEEARGQVELAIRTGANEDFWFLINRTDVPVELPGVEGEALLGSITPLAPRGVAILRRSH